MSFFFHDASTPEIYTLSLHDALPISRGGVLDRGVRVGQVHPAAVREPAGAGPGRAHRRPRRGRHRPRCRRQPRAVTDRKSTRLNSSHLGISYAVFCLKKKKTTTSRTIAFAKVVAIGTMLSQSFDTLRLFSPVEKERTRTDVIHSTTFRLLPTTSLTRT